MNYTLLLSHIFKSIVGVGFYLVLTNDSNINNITFAFLIFFTVSVLTTKILKYIFYSQVITNKTDEYLHPVTDVVKILHRCNLEKHYGKEFKLQLLEVCECGSDIYRVYKEDTDNGTYFQFICAVCNKKTTGIEFNWKMQKV